MQALTLMNDRAYVEAALGLARRALTERAAASDDAARVQYMFRLATARRPRDVEARHLQQVVARERRRLAADPAAAAALVAQAAAIGGHADTDPVEFGAWFCVATVLLNLDEVITKG